MPRGVKGTAKPKTARTAKKATKPVQTKKERKAYPSVDERIAMADQSIERLQKLNSERETLIEKTEKTLVDRKSALEKSQTALEKALKKKARLVASKDKPIKAPKEKLTSEQLTERRKAALAKAREAKKAEKAKYDALMAKLNESGKSVDELLAELKA